MTAIDTNVLVRVITRDDAHQFAAAVKVMKSHHLWVSKTVLLETAWVLQHAYGLGREVVLDALRRVAGYQNLAVEDEVSVTRALGWFEKGMDFADALHLASSGDADEFVTFDRKLAAHAADMDGAVPLRLLDSTG